MVYARSVASKIHGAERSIDLSLSLPRSQRSPSEKKSLVANHAEENSINNATPCTSRGHERTELTFFRSETPRSRVPRLSRLDDWRRKEEGEIMNERSLRVGGSTRVYTHVAMRVKEGQRSKDGESRLGRVEERNERGVGKRERKGAGG